MRIKAIVCDLDGTLLSSENTIMPKTKQKLIELQRQGILLVLASGRSYSRILPDAISLEMDHFAGKIIDVNGTSIFDVKSRKRVRLSQLDSSEIGKINDYFVHFNVEIQYTQDNSIYTYLPERIYKIKRRIRGEMRLPSDYPWTGGMYSWLCDSRDGYPNQYMIRNTAEAPDSCNKISIVQDPQNMLFVKHSLEQASIAKHFEFVFSDPRKLEVTKTGVNKGSALSKLLNQTHIHPDEVIAFGDSENDISIFKHVKYSVAMKNSLPSAKNAANYLTDDNDHEGIYHFLKKILPVNK